MNLDSSAQPPNYQLAQINVATAMFDMDDARMDGFTGRIDAVNQVAERAPGFVWRLQGDSGNALDIQVSDDPRFIINISVWETPNALEDFVWKTIHAKVYNGKAQWFPATAEAHMALWWVPIGHEPTPAEGMERLLHLRDHGPSDTSFSWESLPNVKLWQQSRCG
jgi:hypothetical protein